MKSRRLRTALAVAVAVASIAAAAIFFFTRSGGGAKPVSRLNLRYDALDTHAVAIALVEKPDSDSIRCARPLERHLRERCEKMGLEFTLDGDEGKADIMFVTGGEIENGAFDHCAAQVVGGGCIAILLDVRGMSAARLKKILERLPLAGAHLWMVAEHDWIVTARDTQERRLCSDFVSLFSFAPAFEVFVKASIETPWDVFASYAGRALDVMEAFSGDLSVEVRPEFFVSREIPPVDWIDRDDVDEDIFAKIVRETRSVQVVRRAILEGNMLSRDGGDAEKAISRWAAAMLRNPRDPMLLERLYRLAVNAKAFLEVGNLQGAAKCYETMISVRPGDIAALEEYARITARLGMLEVSRAAKKRAEELKGSK
jgi:hypothetical protein